MPQTIQAIYEDGVLKPLRKLDIAEHQRLDIVILEDDLPLLSIARVAEKGGAYDFLHHPAEDVYCRHDGEAV